MEKKNKENSTSLEDLLAMFEGVIFQLLILMHRDIWVRFQHLLLSVEWN